MTNTNVYWEQYKEKEVILIIEDKPFPKKREGIFIDIDETHIWLKTKLDDELKPFLRGSVKRVEFIRNNKETKENEPRRT